MRAGLIAALQRGILPRCRIISTPSEASLLSLAIPSGRETAILFQEVIRRWHATGPALEWERVEDLFAVDLAALEGQLAYLGVINCFQWHLEDECRARYESPPVLARLKHHIDASNQRRVRRMDEIDRCIAGGLQALRSEPERARLAVVTPANLFDRLSILELKRYHANVSRREETASLQRSVELLNEQIDDLCLGIDELMQDLITGHRRLKFYQTVKLYGVE